jgi:hypothetical protein
MLAVALNPQLDRYLGGHGDVDPTSVVEGRIEIENGSPHNQSQVQQERNPFPIRQRRKRLARRLDAETKEFRQPDEQLCGTLFDLVSLDDDEAAALVGLGKFGTKYSVDFDISPLALGTFFHASTFVGSGDYQRSLFMKHRDLDVATGKQTVYYGAKVCTWSTWDEQMATDVRDIFQSSLTTFEKISNSSSSSPTAEATHREVNDMLQWLRTIITSNANNLSFSDPIDRVSFVGVFQDLLSSLMAMTSQILDSPSAIGSLGLSHALIRALSLQLGLATQLLAITRHSPEVDSTKEQQILKTIAFGADTLLEKILRLDTANVQEFLERNRSHISREAGIRDADPVVEATVIVNYALEEAGVPGFSFWAVVNKHLLSRVDKTVDVFTLEKIWLNIFSFLPLLELDVSGTIKVGKRFETSVEDWGLVKTLLDKMFSLCSALPSHRKGSANDYLRVILRRCHMLVQGWGWKKCDAVIGVIFDFFAQNKLAPLPNEELRGSPRFLELLDENPTLDTTAADRSYHIFLKLLAVGIRGVLPIYSEKKVISIVWRCIPNHNRLHRKENDLRKEDLDAIRNHHDLLCTLFWTSPASFGPRLLELVRNLVDHGLSHREICRLNIKAWTNLVRFQLTMDDDVSRLNPFVLWFNDMIAQSISQFRLARTELELEYERMKPADRTTLSTHFVQATIGRNQSHILATISDVVLAMKTAVKASKSKLHAVKLLAPSNFDKIFSIFDAKSTETVKVVVEALAVYLLFLHLPKTCVQSSEESQEFGSWPEDDISVDFIREPVFQLLSSCFGSERAPDDSLATRVIETWAEIASIQVAQGEAEWSSFLDTYGDFSWERLPDTDQKRKFTCCFYSLVIQLDNTAFVNYRSRLLSAWLVSLLERGALLKFQHQLTTAVLNAEPEAYLVCNLPFYRNANQKYDITSDQIRERRLGLISSVLSNMRQSHDDAHIHSPSLATSLRQEYTVHLRDMMAGMKKNYLELGHGDSVKGAYVDFVHRVVEFLQQYTSEICPVDRFFTDSALFPLPEKDPMYVVGKLKCYREKLDNPRRVKQLAIFIQSISERAAIENQQSYLVEQLQAAMNNDFENDSSVPSLRSTLFEAVFPAYLELSLKTPCGWILVRPVLEASSLVLDKMIFCFSITDLVAVDTTVSVLATTLATLQQSVGSLIDHIGPLNEPRVLHTLCWIFRTVTSTLSCLDYIKRRTGKGRDVLRSVSYFKYFSIFCAQTLSKVADTSSTVLYEEVPEPRPEFASIRQYCVSELSQSLQANWVRDGDRYFIRQRGGASREVLVHVGSFDVEKAAVFESIVEFHNVLARMTGLGRL